MDAKQINQHVEPFDIYSDNTIRDVYRSMSLNEGLELIRGVPIFKWKKWKGDTSDYQIIISSDGFVAEAINSSFFGYLLKQPKSIFGDLIFKSNESNGIYEWDILVEKLDGNIGDVYIGICDMNEKCEIDREWVLGSDGFAYHNKQLPKWYSKKFKEGDKITVHLDMKNRTCAFSINNNRERILSGWKNIPSQVYPVISLGCESKLRVETHMKN
ncbi:hypothetical protein C1645_800951 [Glomus cerebriforme]|uniref:B30.2/SPRY domain-containing protein n=1 Tax=Glomus cerebriforme TaxID=658196 RepID=A0A397TLX8_9GLOM|nr:hypothetical protein C1645_800951 [Glomus cerebriforme]